MTLSARIDAQRWRAHQRDTHARITSALDSDSDQVMVPVIKGNGYGLGQGLLAREAEQLPCSAIAVGTVFELESVLPELLADVVVLEPFDPRDTIAAEQWWHIAQRWDHNRVLRTIASAEGLRALVEGKGNVRVLLELRTSLHRFGFEADALAEALADPAVRRAIDDGRIVVEGASIHLPLAQPPANGPRTMSTNRAEEAVHLVTRWRTFAASIGRPDAPAWVSHLDDAELADVASHALSTPLRLRTGTRLWLGDRDAIEVRSTVLGVEQIRSSTAVGYRQRNGRGTLLVVSGGTAHGIGLSAPTAATTARQRLVAAGTGALDATGRAKSPFSWSGRELWFAEPPHQHHSMVWLPAGTEAPSIGDAVQASVRFTTTRFDSVELV